MNKNTTTTATTTANAKEESPKVISKETVHRLIKDIKQIAENPLTDNDIYYIHDEEDLLKGYAMIVGPADTPYFGGYYFFEIQYPTDYPHSPPLVKYCTNGDNIRFNPNLYINGKVCVSLLNTWRGEQWTSCQSISTILLTLCTLLCKDPLLNEPGVTMGHVDLQKYTKIIEYKNIDVAILRMIQKHEEYFPIAFDAFYPYMKEHFFKNSAAIMLHLEQKVKEHCIYINAPNQKITTSMYNLNVVVNYSVLNDMFINTHDELKNSMK